MRVADIFLIPYFDRFSPTFEKEADCLSINSVTNRDRK